MMSAMDPELGNDVNCGFATPVLIYPQSLQITYMKQ